MSECVIKITENRQVQLPKDIVWGCVKENAVQKMELELPESINGTPTSEFNIIMEFEDVASGWKFTKELQGCECEVCENITAFKNLKAQVSLIKLVDEETEDYLVWKSEIFNISFEESINATEKIKIIF